MQKVHNLVTGKKYDMTIRYSEESQFSVFAQIDCLQLDYPRAENLWMASLAS